MNDTPKTLLELQGAPTTPSRLEDACVVVIDLQEEYASGALPLDGIGAAVEEASLVIERARAAGTPVVHVLHETGAGAPVFAPGSEGARPIAATAPLGDETVVTKHLPNAFAFTDLADVVRRTGRKELILVGAMTHMCVSATARAALDLGFRTTVVADACATRPLPTPGGGVLAADAIHRAALAELADAFSVVVSKARDLPGSSRAAG